jgi:hypothetical protein
MGLGQYTIRAFSLSELCSRDVVTMRKTNTTGEKTGENLVTLAYLPCDSDEPPLSKGLGKSLTTVVQISCNSLDVMCQCTPHYMQKHELHFMRMPNGIYGLHKS